MDPEVLRELVFPGSTQRQRRTREEAAEVGEPRLRRLMAMEAQVGRFKLDQHNPPALQLTQEPQGGLALPA